MKYVTEWIAVDDLHIDCTYDRPLNETFVKKLSLDFNPALAKVLLVNRRNTGQLFVIDGQHRLAAMKKNKIDMALCHVFQGLDQQEEAKLFTAGQELILKLSALDQFKAKLVARDNDALEIQRIVEKHGLHIQANRAGEHSSRSKSSPTTIYAAATLQEIYRKDKGKILDEILALAVLSWPGKGEVFKDRFLLGLAHFHQLYQGEYKQQDFIEKMNTLSLIVVHQKAHTFATEGGGSMITAYSKSFWHLYNRGRRTRMLSYKYT